MIHRRDFLKNAGALLAGGIALPYLAEANKVAATRPVGIQLFTLFQPMNADPLATLKQVADVGYKEIESAFSLRGGYYGYKPKEFKKIVEDLGMTWRAHHALGAPIKLPPGALERMASAGKPTSKEYSEGLAKSLETMPNLRDSYQQLVEDAGEGGLSYLVCASTPVANVDEINKSIGVFQKAGEACKKAGIGFAYHNHATEFDPVEGGKTPYELILSQTDKDLVKMELDLAWATKAGKDPVELFRQHPGRFPLWHTKDIKSDLKTITEVGNGVVDFKRIFSAAQTAGLKYFFVEQDMAPSIDSIKTSYQHLEKVLA